MAMFLCSGVYKRRIQQDELMALNCVPKKQRKQLDNTVADLQVQCRFYDKIATKFVVL
uniref:Uncharacterized protein n=1 Tax=Oryza brachyantha TaxID=4533 RepID=J3L950_ORYBR